MTTKLQVEAIYRWALSTRVKYSDLGWTIPPRKKPLSHTDFVSVISSKFPECDIQFLLSIILAFADKFTEAAYKERKKKEFDALYSNGGFFSDEPSFITATFPQLGLEICPGGSLAGEGAKRAVYLLNLRASQYNKTITKEMQEHGIAKLDLKVIPWALEAYIDEKTHEMKEACTNKIVFDPLVDTDLSELRRFTKAIRSPAADPKDYILDFVVLWHMVWQVKRKMFGLVADPILATFIYGMQNTGKSTALRKLFSPVGEYVFDADINNAIDARWSFLSEQYFVLNVEELLGMAKADVEKLKSFVTKHVQVTRILGGHNSAVTKQNLSIIGSTNRPISSLIMDETGMRRWYQITGPQSPGEKMDFSAINSVDYFALWQSIDETRETSLLYDCPEHVSHLAARQESWRRFSETETFLRSTGYWPLLEGGSVVELNLDAIMLKLAAWCEGNGMKLPDRRRVSHQLFDLRVNSSGSGRTEKWFLAAPPGTRAGNTTTPDIMQDEFASLSIPVDMGPIN